MARRTDSILENLDRRNYVLELDLTPAPKDGEPAPSRDERKLHVIKLGDRSESPEILEARGFAKSVVVSPEIRDALEAHKTYSAMIQRGLFRFVAA